jgi:hypothetical protein
VVIKVNKLRDWKPGIRQYLMLLILLSCSVLNDLYSQTTKTKPTRQSSVEAFSKGDFEKAYGEFRELLLVYPKDPLYKYYAGVCLVKLNRNSEQAESVLTEALKASSGVKALPADVRFYLGRAQQMSGKFQEAVVSYNLFIEEGGKKAAKELNTQEYIQQCNEKKGMAESQKASEEVIIKVPEKKVIGTENPPSQVMAAAETAVTDSGRRKIPKSYDRILDDALSLQNKADSMSVIASGQKKKLEKASPAEKTVLRNSISEIEIAAAAYQKAADQKYSEAQNAMNPNRDSISREVPEAVITKPAIKQDTVKKTVIKEAAPVAKQSDNRQNKIPDSQVDINKKVPEIIKKPVEVFSVFEVLPNPVTDPKEKIEIDPVIPPGLIYRIQIAVFRNPVAPAYFKGITPIYGFKMTGTDKTIYYAGMFRKSSDASAALIKVKAKGFKDAFVVAISNKKTVSADRAAILEKESGKKPFTVLSDIAAENSIDTVPPTLAFRVEVTRSLKPLKDDVIQGITKMAGSRGLDIQKVDDGKFAYLIGKFITFESAAEYTDLLIRNGYRDARVVAWLGKREVAIDTAKKLFDDLK